MEGESVSDFSKRFNKMYNKIPAEIKPSEASAQISYAGAFDPDFCLLLRERRATSLAQMQDAAIEVESNILAADRLRSKADVDRRKGKSEASTSGPSLPHTQVDELTQMMKFLSEEMERLKVERRQVYKGPQSTENKGGFRRPNNFTPPNVQRKEEETEKTREFRLLFRTILWPKRKKGRQTSLILKSIASEKLLLFLISLKQLTRNLSWIVS
jgi:uncharacterized small protein (DUF1192 family)